MAFVAIIWLGCGGENGSGPNKPPANGSIHGKVSDQFTELSVTGVSVSIAGQGDNTDVFGYYSIDDIPPGEYNLSFSKREYEDLEKLVFIHSDLDIDMTVKIKPDLKSGTGALGGYAYDKENGQGLNNVIINCGGLTARTNDQGFYYLINIPKGNQELAIFKPGYFAYESNINIVENEYSSKSVYLAAKPIIDTLVIYSNKDVFVGSSLPDHNYDYSNDTHYGIALKLAPEGSHEGEYRIYVYFDLSSIPDSVIIDKATITMLNAGGDINNSSTEAVCGALMITDFNMRISDFYWEESELTWNSPLNLSINDDLDSGWLFHIHGPDEDLIAPVTVDIQLYSNNALNYRDQCGWMIQCLGSVQGDNNQEYKAFYSSEWRESSKPYLTIIYHRE